MFCRAVVVAFGLLIVGPGAASAENWPQWRGPGNDGLSHETKLATTWDDTKNIAWKLAMPAAAGSTPAVWGDKLFLTSEDGADVVLMCVGTDGKERWRQKLGGHNGRKYMSGEGNNASASPSTDGQHVWAFDGAGHLACYTVDGKQVWSLNTQEKYGSFRIQHGMHNTPVIDGDRLYMNLLHSNAWLVIAFDKTTGKELWKHERQSDATAENEQSYASPSVWRQGGTAYLVVHGNDYCTAHSLDDGKELWRLAGLNPQRPGEQYHRTQRFVASPVVSADLIVVPTAKKGPVVAVKPDARGKIEPGGAGELWRLPRSTPDVPSPLIHDGLVYLCGESGLLTCVDAKTGKEVYPPEQLHKAIYRASPVAADGKIYLLARDGVATVIKAGRSYEKLAENKLTDDTSASLAIANGTIYIRGWKNLYAIRP
ncbi:MAG: PQQ-like beta-propeller repeat protein [Gemmataceae bacterium]|nr:PQQ-like beta-propeller repeat protein [Gemmataceae bacterium]